ncbi:MAG: hypothetical protein ACJ73S_09575 [Mycobacteriales bacterium]
MLDAMSLNHFARADRLDVLHDLLLSDECWTTVVVQHELLDGVEAHPAIQNALELDWLRVAQGTTYDEIERFAQWVRRVGSGRRDRGEASVFATAERLKATAICDDQKAVKAARKYLPSVHGNIWLMARACRSGKLSLAGAAGLVDELRRAELRLPCTGTQFEPYVRQHGLL